MRLCRNILLIVAPVRTIAVKSDIMFLPTRNNDLVAPSLFKIKNRDWLIVFLGENEAKTNCLGCLFYAIWKIMMRHFYLKTVF